MGRRTGHHRRAGRPVILHGNASCPALFDTTGGQGGKQAQGQYQGQAYYGHGQTFQLDKQSSGDASMWRRAEIGAS
jgi:hypothetical protein